MTEDPPYRLTVEELYGEFAEELPEGVTGSLLDESLNPRSPEMLFDIASDLGVDEGDVVLDAGCRDGRHVVKIAERFGCRTVGVDLVGANLRRRTKVLAAVDRDVERRVAFVQGDLQALPFRDSFFDFVWNRDVMIHVPDLVAAFRECRRVLRPGGRMLTYQMFATPRLSEDDAARLWPPLAAVEANADPDSFERSVAEAGWRIEQVDSVGSEWREQAEESGDRRTSEQLLRAARLLRSPARYVEAMGRTEYEGELANALWGVYQMIGKLSGRVYVLA